MQWEFRFVNMPSENGGEDWFALREVYYNDDGTLMGHAEPCVGSETQVGTVELVDWWVSAIKLPALHEDDFKDASFKGDE
jgi:hypothetical protein